VELVFTVLLAKFRFGEKLGPTELLGVALVGVGIVLLLLGM
jgi:drug/metabolite transporter (DMT)-like permease